MNYIYGPVQSRRMGLSLGVSLTPLKTCSFDCVYCQLGPTTVHTSERASYVPVQEIVAQLESWFKQNSELAKKLDYVTLSGFGEPTLHAELGSFIDEARKISSAKIAVITNSSALIYPEVRQSLAKADLVVPSLDAVTDKIFDKIDLPHPNIKIEDVIQGLIDFRKEFFGTIWLEVMLVKGFNDDLRHIRKLKKVIDSIDPDKIQLNTPVRRTAKEHILPPSPGKLQKIKELLGEKCEIA
jgi:wyosine [tRNA(Phe)-imidazoG37] synthetase (radical SAM superfamily)